MSIKTHHVHQLKQAPKRNHGQLKMADLSEDSHQHLWRELFPLVVELKAKARAAAVNRTKEDR